MTLFPGLDAGRESMMAHGTAIGTVADNLTNSNTPGYKSERPEFEDIFAAGQGSLFGAPVSTGGGSRTADVTISHGKQGAVETTDRDLDFAIQGDGFFVLTDGTQQFYTRNGTFFTNTDGNLVNADGLSVMGFTAASTDTAVALNIGSVAAAPTATDLVNLTVNLDASTVVAPLGAAPTTFTDLQNTAQYSTTIRMYDGLGQAHEASLYFFHTGTAQWTAQAWVDGGALAGGTAGTPSMIGSGTVTFTAGTIPTGTTVQVPVTANWLNGSTTTANVDFSKSTGYAAPSTAISLSSNGNGTGDVEGFELQNDGSLLANLSNGTSVEVGTIALADFVNPDGLKRVGDSMFSEGDGSAGDSRIGAPTSEGRGATSNSALENSNVDTANEFVGLIQYQRGYQASSKVITTVDDLISSTIQIA